MTLEDKHPALSEEFTMGNFVVHKTSRNFSALALDQVLEQANAVIKDDGGAIGLTENPSALRKWMVYGPEVSHLVSLYEMEAQTKEVSITFCIMSRHHIPISHGKPLPGR